MCECIDTVNKLLAEHNARLVCTYNLSTGRDFPKLGVEKIETRKRGSAPLMIPTYCPFCGEPYESQAAVPADGTQVEA
jgi:hypothetical protein